MQPIAPRAPEPSSLVPVAPVPDSTVQSAIAKTESRLASGHIVHTDSDDDIDHPTEATHQLASMVDTAHGNEQESTALVIPPLRAQADEMPVLDDRLSWPQMSFQPKLFDLSNPGPPQVQAPEPLPWPMPMTPMGADYLNSPEQMSSPLEPQYFPLPSRGAPIEDESDSGPISLMGPFAGPQSEPFPFPLPEPKSEPLPMLGPQFQPLPLLEPQSQPEPLPLPVPFQPSATQPYPLEGPQWLPELQAPWAPETPLGTPFPPAPETLQQPPMTELLPASGPEQWQAAGVMPATPLAELQSEMMENPELMEMPDPLGAPPKPQLRAAPERLQPGEMQQLVLPNSQAETPLEPVAEQALVNADIQGASIAFDDSLAQPIEFMEPMNPMSPMEAGPAGSQMSFAGPFVVSPEPGAGEPSNEERASGSSEPSKVLMKGFEVWKNFNPLPGMRSNPASRAGRPIVVDSMSYETDALVDETSDASHPRILRWDSVPLIQRKVIYPKLVTS